jgi:DNA-directed RNA polymerase specialized sigma24 family protein
MKKTKKKPTAPKQRQTYTLDTKANALRLYLIGLTLSEISKIVDAPVRTIEKWYISDNWKPQRETKEVHLKALDLYDSGKTYKEVAKILNKSLPTIGRYIKIARNENDIN